MITFQSGDITDVRLGSTLIKSVCVGSVEVWSAVKPKPWLLTGTDHFYGFNRGYTWFPSAPDFSSKPAPMKGCLFLCVYRGTEFPDFVANVAIFDGTNWRCSDDGNAGRYNVEPRAAIDEPPFITGWWNGPTAANDAQDDFNTMAPGALYLVPWAEPDGVHLLLRNKDDTTQTFVCPYPAGMTMADLPPTENLHPTP
jgi:hypothetical protein